MVQAQKRVPILFSRVTEQLRVGEAPNSGSIVSSRVTSASAGQVIAVPRSKSRSRGLAIGLAQGTKKHGQI